MSVEEVDLGSYKLGWHDTEQYVFKPKKGINADIVREISWHKSEPEWMTNFRLAALERFEKKPMLPWFAENMPDIDFNDIFYYIKPIEKQVSEWDMLPKEMQTTYERLGIPEAEGKFLAGVTAQYESEVVYHKNREDLEELGVIFTGAYSERTIRNDTYSAAGFYDEQEGVTEATLPIDKNNDGKIDEASELFPSKIPAYMYYANAQDVRERMGGTLSLGSELAAGLMPGTVSARSSFGWLRRSTLRLALAGRSLVQLTPTEISPDASSEGISR